MRPQPERGARPHQCQPASRPTFSSLSFAHLAHSLSLHIDDTPRNSANIVNTPRSPSTSVRVQLRVVGAKAPLVLLNIVNISRSPSTVVRVQLRVPGAKGEARASMWSTLCQAAVFMRLPTFMCAEPFVFQASYGSRCIRVVAIMHVVRTELTKGLQSSIPSGVYICSG